MFNFRKTFALSLSILLLFAAFGTVLAQEGPPLQNSIFIPGEIASSGDDSVLEMPFVIQSETIGNANVFCISYPNTVTPSWPASATSAKGDVYTRTTGSNSYCLSNEVEYVEPSASSEATDKEQLDLDLTFGPQPAGDTYTFTLRQIECGGEIACRASSAAVDVDISVASPTAIQLDGIGTTGSTSYLLPALLVLLALASMSYTAHLYRRS